MVGSRKYRECTDSPSEPSDLVLELNDLVLGLYSLVLELNYLDLELELFLREPEEWNFIIRGPKFSA